MDGWADAFGSDSGVRVYTEVLVPRVFEPWARLLLGELGVQPGERVLDVATGPGVVARLAAAAVGPSGSVVGCDISPSMLAIARSHPSPENAAPIDYRECPADRLAAADSAFDVVACQQGLQFFPDRLAALAECRRALRPGGRVGIAVWSRLEENPPFAALVTAVGEVLGADAANRFRGGPWGLDDADELRGLVSGAMFEDVRVVRRTVPVAFEGGPAQVLAVLATSPVADEVAQLDAGRREQLAGAADRALASLVRDGAVVSELTANVAVATSP